MMSKKREKILPKPTEAEWAILRVIWQMGSGTVRAILNKMNEDKTEQIGYTTVLKMIQIMTEKGLVEKDDSVRPQIYRAVLTQEKTQQQFVSDLIEKIFDGSARNLVMQALATKETSNEELAHIEQLLNKIEGGKK